MTTPEQRLIAAGWTTAQHRPGLYKSPYDGLWRNLEGALHKEALRPRTEQETAVVVQEEDQ